jgi:hypothetical protein
VLVRHALMSSLRQAWSPHGLAIKLTRLDQSIWIGIQWLYE